MKRLLIALFALGLVLGFSLTVAGNAIPAPRAPESCPRSVAGRIHAEYGTAQGAIPHIGRRQIVHSRDLRRDGRWWECSG